MKKVTDPELLAKLNGESGLKKVTDPDILRKLNGEGIRGIVSDIKESISGVPGELYDFFANLPEQAYASGKQAVTNPLRAAGNVGAGFLEGLKGAANIPSNIASYLHKKDIGRGNIEDRIKKLHIGDTGLEQAVLGSPQEGDELLRGIGSFAPYAKVGSILGGLGKGIKGAAVRAGTAGAYATGQNQDPLKAALMGIAGEGLTRVAQKAFKPGRFLPSSPLSNEELINAAGVTRGTETGLGNVIDNPILQQQYENVLPNIPFSGTNQAMQRTASEITNRGESILDTLKGHADTGDIGSTLQKALKTAESEARKEKNEKFKLLNDAAEKEGVQTERINLRNTAKKYLKEIESDPDLEAISDNSITSLLKELSDTNKKQSPIIKNPNQEKNYAFDFIKGTKTEIPPESPKPEPKKKSTLKSTDILRGKLREAQHDASASNNTHLASIYKALKDAAVKDINESIDNSGNKHLDKLRDNAMKFYEKEYAPFSDKDIMKFTRKGGDPDLLISTFLKNNRLSDRSKLLGKLTLKLNNDDKNLLAYSYFSKALEDGNLNPIKLKTLFKNLGTNQKHHLLGNQPILKELDNYTRLVNKNKEPLNIMFNPQTGKRNLSVLPFLSALGSSIGTMATGSIPGGILSAAIPSLVSKPITKALTSEKLREKVIKGIIKSREKKAKGKKNMAPFVNALMQASQTTKPMELEVNRFQGYE